MLGIGTLWDTKGLVGSVLDGCPYSGSKASEEFEALSGCPTIPIDLSGGVEGCYHWSEACLGKELMTPFIDEGTGNPFSRISIASLEDIGYTVDYSSADRYRTSDLNSTLPGCLCNPARQLLRASDKPTTSRRAQVTLSSELHRYAVAVGLAYLEDRDGPSLEGRGDGDDIVYVGNQVVSILVEQNQHMFVVVVQKEIE